MTRLIPVLAALAAFSALRGSSLPAYEPAKPIRFVASGKATAKKRNKSWAKGPRGR